MQCLNKFVIILCVQAMTKSRLQESIYKKLIISGRTFRILYGNVMSFIVYIMCSVPQGLVIGPLKTELLLPSSSHSCAAMTGKYLVSGADTAVACSHVLLLGVDISSDLSLDHHVSLICTGCYYRLHQL